MAKAQKVLQRFSKVVKLYSMTSDTGGTIKFVFLDAQCIPYIHYQIIPDNLNPKCRSKAIKYISNLRQAHAMQGGRVIPFEEFLPDATDGMKIRASSELVGSYFLVDVAVREYKRKDDRRIRTFRDADYVDYLPPSKAYREKLGQLECSEQYKAMVLNRKPGEDLLDYWERINSEIRTF